MKPLDPFSEVVNEQRRWNAEWYGWLTTLSGLIIEPTTVAKLPAPVVANRGARGFVTDATATTFNSIVLGGGTNKVPVVSDGTHWLIG